MCVCVCVMGMLGCVMANVLDCNIIVTKFELKLRNCIYFQANALGKKYKIPYPPSYGLNIVSLLFF